jgi:hypothetical protein
MSCRFFYFSLLLLMGCIGGLSAETGFRKYAGEFMAIDVSARAQAMGGAFTSQAGDVYATFYNPAGLMKVQSTQIAFTHTRQFISSINYDYLGFARPLSNNKVIGFSVIRLGVDGIQDSRAAAILSSEGELLNIDFSKVTEFNSADYVFLLSLATSSSEKFSWGINMKLVRRDLADNSANGLGFDGGMQYQFNDKIIFSALVRNITTTLIAWNTGEKELVSPTMRLGSAYKIQLSNENSYFVPNVDLVFQSQETTNLAASGSGIFGAAFGGELVFRNTLALRGGLDDLQRVNFGVGLRIPKIHIDYSFTSYAEELGNAHRIGLMVDLGE